MFIIINTVTNEIIGTCDSVSFNAGTDTKLIETTETDISGYTYDGTDLTPPHPPTPVVPLTNIVITNSELVGKIYWVQENSPLVFTGDLALPDGTYMLMAERVVDAKIVIDDHRFKAVVASGKMTVNATFKTTGNYLFSAERLNRGLDRIGAGVRLSFEDIEFDVYV